MDDYRNPFRKVPRDAKISIKDVMVRSAPIAFSLALASLVPWPVWAKILLLVLTMFLIRIIVQIWPRKR
jgi:hypothetical protein